MNADLHLHTTESDGTWLPSQIGVEAKRRSISLIAITDHDTTAAISTVAEHAPPGITVIPGIELSTNDGQTQEVHILGYWIDTADQQLQNRLSEFREMRRTRANRIIKRLNELGIGISLTDVTKLASRDVISRSHIASALQQKGIVKTKSEAFNDWIGVDSPAYVPRPKMEPKEAVRLILDSGGVPVLAHPGLLTDISIVHNLIRAGLVGLEVVHSSHSPEQTAHFLQLSRTLGLLPSGGSDCHGPGGKDKMFLGDYTIPKEWVDALAEKRKR